MPHGCTPPPPTPVTVYTLVYPDSVIFVNRIESLQFQDGHPQLTSQLPFYFRVMVLNNGQ